MIHFYYIKKIDKKIIFYEKNYILKEDTFLKFYRNLEIMENIIDHNFYFRNHNNNVVWI